MRKPSRKIVIASIVVLIVASGVAWFVLNQSDESKASNKQGQVTTTTKDDGVKVTKSSDSKKSSSGQPTTPATTVTPAAPYGTFVSNHRPNLSGSPSPNQMNSVCQTTAGVTCEIRFTKDGVVKTLGPEVVGADGYVSWDWRLQDIGISEGSWQIEAIAKSGDKVVSTKDPITLEVSP